MNYEQKRQELKDMLIHEILTLVEALQNGEDLHPLKKAALTIEMNLMSYEELMNISRIYWQQIEAKTGEKVPHQYKYAIDYNLN